MRRVRYSVAMSLDGYIAPADLTTLKLVNHRVFEKTGTVWLEYATA